MMLALPLVWLYSCWSHVAGAASVTAICGFPPVQSAAAQVAKAAFMTCSVWANVTLMEAFTWTE